MQPRTKRRPRNRKTSSGQAGQLFLNAFPISFVSPPTIPVNTYVIQPIDEAAADPDRRVQDVMWSYRRSAQSKQYCRGYGFIVEIDSDRVAVPSEWDIPLVEHDGYSIAPEGSYVATLDDPEHRSIYLGLIRESLKKAFKDLHDEEIGPLWRDFGDYCQMPVSEARSRYAFCRKFITTPRFLSDNSLVLQIAVKTVPLDGRTIAWYYEHDCLNELIAVIRSAQEAITNRKGEPGKVRLWCDESNHGVAQARVVEFADVERLVAEMTDNRNGQRHQAPMKIECVAFPDKRFDASAEKLRVILSSWATGTQHRETILAPHIRVHLSRKIASALGTLDVVGRSAQVSSNPISSSRFQQLDILPPSISVLNNWGQPNVIPQPTHLSSSTLSRRAREKAIAVARNGFLINRTISPLLAWPYEVEYEGGRRRQIARAQVDAMQALINDHLKRRQIRCRFDAYQYRNIEDLRHHVQSESYDAVFVVLPESSSHPYSDRDTHELVKQRLDVVSQCIMFDNTIPPTLAMKREQDLHGDDQKQYRKHVQRYQLCVDNLFVKAGWVPFLPSDAFRFNVHIGIDAGGKLNDRVVAALCHGLSDPSGEVVYRVEEIPVPIKQAEPIPSDALLAGLKQLTDHVCTEIDAAGGEIDFSRVLIYRDGSLLGRGDRWNEIDALHGLHRKLVADGAARPNGVWAAAEVHKRNQLWRFHTESNGRIENPVVGQCLIGLESPDQAIVALTGEPYLRQGSASPIGIRMHRISGNPTIEDILTDTIWEADMGFTKLDMGRSLPWILHIADAGALQLSRSYGIAGVTA